MLGRGGGPEQRQSATNRLLKLEGRASSIIFPSRWPHKGRSRKESRVASGPRGEVQLK